MEKEIKDFTIRVTENSISIKYTGDDRNISEAECEVSNKFASYHLIKALFAILFTPK